MRRAFQTRKQSKKGTSDAKNVDRKKKETGLPSQMTALLPSEEDRVRMLRITMAVAEAVIAAENGKIEDETVVEDEEDVEAFSECVDKDNYVVVNRQESTTKGNSKKGEKSNHKNPPSHNNSSILGSSSHAKKVLKEEIDHEKHQRRLVNVLWDDLFRTVSSSLLIYSVETHFINKKNVPLEQPDDAFGCVVLLLTNLILLCGEKGYDARVRHVLKTACVCVLSRVLEIEVESQSASAKNSSKHLKALIESPEFHHQRFAMTFYKDSDIKASTRTDKVNAADCEKSSSDVPEESTITETDYMSTPPALSTFLDETYQKEHTDTVVVNTLDERDERDSRIQFIATQKFQAIEKAIATGTMKLLTKETRGQNDKEKDENTGGDDTEGKSSSKGQMDRKKLVRGLQIGAAGVVAGGLLAVTGGMAAPGIAAGIAALGIFSGSAAAAIAMLTSATTLATLFGVGGGGLAAYRMKLRTDGLAEFRIRQEKIESTNTDAMKTDKTLPSMGDLHATLCISGWLHDKCDFQRPWGVQPSDPPISSKLELLQRFYAIHCPEQVSECGKVLELYKNQEDSFWSELKEQYGASPDELLPLETDTKNDLPFSSEERQLVQQLLEKVVLTKSHTSYLEQIKTMNTTNATTPDGKPASDSVPFISSVSDSKTGELSVSDSIELTNNAQLPTIKEVATTDKAVRVVWDWHSVYGGDLYTLTWESDRLLKFCDVVNKLIKDIASKATQEALKQTALATLMAAITWPKFILDLTQKIDDPYQIVAIRADMAGVELANSLLHSEESRPVSLVGYSFGARIIFSCLLELARHQIAWEEKNTIEQNGQSRNRGDAPQEKDTKYDLEYKREPASIVEDVVLMGMPRYINRKKWSRCRHIVGGRMINCYSSKDWFLSLMFRYKNAAGLLRDTAGGHAVKGVKGVENFDVSSLVNAHGRYCMVLPEVLRIVGFSKPHNIVRNTPTASTK